MSISLTWMGWGLVPRGSIEPPTILRTRLEGIHVVHFRQHQHQERGQEEGGPNAAKARPGRGWARSVEVEADDAGAHVDGSLEPRAIEGDDEEVKGSFDHTYCTRSRRLCALLPKYRPRNTATMMM